MLGGLAYCEASLVEGLDGVPLTDAGFPGGRGFPDVHAVPDLTTLRSSPWQPDTAWMLADLRGKDGPSPLCCRDALARQVAVLEERGLSAVVASEPEFYLVREGVDGSVLYSPGTGMAYTTGVRADPDGVLRAIHAALDSFDLGVTTANREFSPGQFEINLSHTDALAAADRAFLLEEIVKDVAASHGLLATFMAKPFTRARGLEPPRPRLALARRRERLRRAGRPAERPRRGVRRRGPRPRAGPDRPRLADRQLVQAARRDREPRAGRRGSRRRRSTRLPPHPLGPRALDPDRGARRRRLRQPLPPDGGDPRRGHRRDRPGPRSGDGRHGRPAAVARGRARRPRGRRRAVPRARAAASCPSS